MRFGNCSNHEIYISKCSKSISYISLYCSGGGETALERCGGVAEGDVGLALSLLVHGLGTGHAVCWNGSGTDCPEDGAQLPALQGLHTVANRLWSSQVCLNQ